MTDEGLHEYLESMVQLRKDGNLAAPPEWKYLCLEDLVLQEGSPFKPQPLPVKYETYRGKQKECFKNAADAVIFNENLRYVEGFALSIIPVQHAWLVDEDDLVIELTWPNPGDAYRGVVIPDKTVMTTAITRGSYGVLDNWEESWPCLREGVPSA